MCERFIDFKELADVIVEAGKSKSVRQVARLKNPGRANVANSSLKAIC